VSEVSPGELLSANVNPASVDSPPEREKQPPSRILRLRWVMVLGAVLYGVLMVALSGATWSRLYSASPYHRLQADALLARRLCIGDSLSQMHSGLAWHNGRVQQVWGLGVGLWLAPFEALSRVAGRTSFPDRLALGIAFALLAFYVGTTTRTLFNTGKPTFAVGLAWLVLMCPALWTLTRASQLVFEETVLYGILLSLAILVALLRVVCLDSRRDFWLCCLLAALSGFVRPTHAIYGVIGALICAGILIRRHRNFMPRALAGLAVVLAGFVLLATTNTLRFGSPTEFGHRLTLTNPGMIYLTRFANPFREATWSRATRELLSLLFFSPERNGGAFDEHLFAGQAPATRWRKLDLTSFDWTYAVFGAVGAVGAMGWLRRNRRSKRQESACLPTGAMLAGILIWSGVSLGALGLFYLRFPVIGARYLLDFAPALTGLLILFWFLISSRPHFFSLAALASWLFLEIASARVPAELPGLREGPQPSSTTPASSLSQFEGSYSETHVPSQSGLAFNGHGWEPETGFADDVVVLAVDRPEFVELHLTGRRAMNGQSTRADRYHAVMDGQSLPLRSVVENADELRVAFDVPEKIRRQGQDQLLFLCFSGAFDPEDRESQRFLHSVRWR